MVDHWLGISSAEYDSHCGDSLGRALTEALDGTDYWYHIADEVHSFVLDLGQTYTIKKVRGRSLSSYDPTDINIYIDDNNPPTTLCEEGITTWKDTAAWVEITLTTEGTGRYIKVEIEDTESVNNWVMWGQLLGDPHLSIFDAYGDVAGGVEHTHSASDTLSMSDSLAAALTMNVALSDTLSISDSLVPVAEFKVALADTLNMSDLLSVAATYNVALADTLGITDSLDAAAEYVVALADTMNISDALVTKLIVEEIIRRAAIVRKIGLPTAQNVGMGM